MFEAIGYLGAVALVFTIGYAVGHSQGFVRGQEAQRRVARLFHRGVR